MLDVLSIVHQIADRRTSSMLRCTCKKLSKLKKIPKREVTPDATYYRLEGVLHREDGPAVEWKNGTREWYQYGLRHRRDGPAVDVISDDMYIYKEYGTISRGGVDDKYTYIGLYKCYTARNRPIGSFAVKVWMLYGKIHREGGPAIEYSNGYKEWYTHGKLHREDGPAVEHSDGTKMWYVYGQRHREDGPAVEWNSGTKWWYLHGKLHREDGPAIERRDGTGEHYPEGIKYTGYNIRNLLVQKVSSCTIL